MIFRERLENTEPVHPKKQDLVYHGYGKKPDKSDPGKARKRAKKEEKKPWGKN